MMSANSDHDIAIVGIAGRFPGARDLDEFWRNLSQGVESISRLNDDEIVAAGVPEWHLRDPRYVKAAAMLDTAGDFDAGFFGYAPAEAEAMDPQHRLLLELAYEALEHAGCDPGRYAGRVGVFAGAALNTYFGSVGLHERLAEDYIPTLIGNDKDFLSTRISYKLNLTGPSLTVQSACSTSMVAVHLARQSLLSRETDMVLAGAVSVRVPHRAGYFCHRGGVTSPDGHVRAFDARANGTVFGSGGGVLVLKRLADAVADGDAIHAVIKGSAVNNDGATKAGYTAPSVLRQAEVVVEALGNAGVDADTIGYVEAHGSGTSVGDPIEVAALTRAFRRFTARSGFCAIGSVKTNVGHLDAAAGIAGLIKTVLALKNGRLPASLNYVEPNPEIDFEHTPFFVNTRLRDWPHDGPRRAGVMATGMGGTNAHVVLEQAPAPATPHDTRGPHVLVLSAKTAHALDQATERLAAFLDAPAAPRMDDVAHTLQAGRQGFAHRRALVCGAREDAMQGLRDARRMTSGTAPSQRRPVMLLLPGVGDQYVGMGRELYESWPVFAEAVDQCAAILEPHIGVDIRSVLYPPGRERARHEHSARIDLRKMLARDAGAPPDPDTARLNETRFAQPALFTIEYATWRVWQSLGVKPDAIVGHSMGEYVAAVIAGILSLEDALHLVAVRARLANDLPAGAMLAVTLSELELAPLLPDALSVALVNGPHLCVVAGPTDAVAEFEAALTTRLVICRRVRNAHAFHSPLLDPITESFEREVRGVRLHPPAIPCMSNVSGTWITAGEATSAAYWTAHAVRTARFGDALDAVWRFDDPILLEAGPGRTLGVLAMQHPARRARGGEATVIASLPHDYERGADVELLARAIGKLWVAGVEIDWGALPAHGRFKTPLPTYPFERTRHWRAPVPAGNTRPPSAARATPRNPPDQWLYAPSWKRTMSPRVAPSVGAAAGECETWVVFADDTGLSSRLVKRLSGRGHRVITVRPGARFHRVDRNTFAIAAGDAGDYDLLLRTMRESGARPSRIVHAWGVCDRRPSESDDQQLDGALERGIYSLSCLARALAAHHAASDVTLFALCNDACDVIGAESVRPEKATLLGPCLVIGQEYPNVAVRCIDVATSANECDLTADLVTAELCSRDTSTLVAYRHRQRWVRIYEPVVGPPTADRPPVFREEGVYLITGGAGRIGTTIAEYLARRYRARVVIAGRARSLDEQTAARIVSGGGEVMYVEADVASREAVEAALARTLRRYGTLHGVIHAAGVVGNEGYCEVKDCAPDRCDAHFRAKARGLRVLDSVIGETPLDFVLLFSSLASVLGGIGQAAYASANIYMDSFAAARAASGAPWLSVNWDVWRVGAGANFGPGAGTTLDGLGMDAGEATEMLETVLALKQPCMAVSTGDLNARIDQWVSLASLRASDDRTHEPRPLTPRTPIPSSDAPRDDTERHVARIWQETLGVDAVGIHDSFAQLGGHSLLAVRIVAALRRAFQVDLPVRALFDTPTVAELSDAIKARVVAEIDALSEPEARAMAASP